MSQSPPNYMDGVPVKISERFKPPPKITLPQSVVNRLSQIESGAVSSRATFSYEFELEETVLKRITEWRAVRERERYERDERVRLKELERKRLFEEEQKRKLNQICYPNTDDLSSASDEGEDEASEENDESSPSGSSEERQVEHRNGVPPTSVVSASSVQYSQTNKYDTILMPTVLPEVEGRKVDSESTLSFNIPKSTNLLNNNNNTYNKINYSDFENDTSSPFDNVELKSMNDLDILAQVLNLNVSNSGPDRSEEKRTGTAEQESANLKTNSHAIETGVAVNAGSATVQQLLDHSQQAAQYHPTTYQVSQQHSEPNAYYKSYNSYQYGYGQYVAPSTTASAACFISPADSRYLNHFNPVSSTSYQPATQSQYHQSYQQGMASANTYSYFPYTSSAHNTATQSTYAHAYPYNSGYNSSHDQSQLTTSSGGSGGGYNYPTTAVVTPTSVDIAYSGGAGSSSAIKSKSKSVPDIVRQLAEEVQDSAQKRTRNNSQSVAENHQGNSSPASQSATKNFTLYNGLSQAEQNLVTRISSMGFPLERVAAVLKRIGTDDKKIVEHLIPLSELLDLGFEEEKISEALVKFGNNKHQALDYLIS